VSAAVEVVDVRKSYGDVPALTQVNLAIEDRTFVSLLGASGCGKSTLLRIITGFETASGGSVRILDASWPEEPALGGLVLASIVAQETIDGKVRNQAAQLWWLRLDSEAQAIVEAGPLTGHRMDSSERFPRLLRDPSTGLLLAYLIITESADSAYLAVAPLRIGPGSSGPMLIENESRILARECAVDAPVPSSDGRSIAVVCRDREGRAEPPRLVAIGTPGSR